MSDGSNATGHPLFLGVDGGNTKTVALLASSDGTLLGRGASGQSDIYSSRSFGAALDELMLAIQSAANRAKAELSDISNGVLSMAGCDWPEDVVAIRDGVRSRGLDGDIVIVNDALGALRAGSPVGPAISVVCGTAAAVGARDATGNTWHTGWWQEPQGALQLAQHMLRAVYRSELGVDPFTSLTEAALKYFGYDTVEDILYSLTRRSAARLDIAPLAKVLSREADAGDTTACNILVSHGTSLGDYALAAGRRLGILDDDFDLVLAGGVLEHASPLLREAIVRRVQEHGLRARPIVSGIEPAEGALLLAFDSHYGGPRSDIAATVRTGLRRLNVAGASV